MRHSLDGGFWNAGDVADKSWRIFQHSCFQLVKTQGVPVDVILVLKTVTQDDMHHCERKGPIRARHNRNMLVRLLSGSSAQRIDRHDLCSSRPRFQYVSPEMNVRRD